MSLKKPLVKQRVIRAPSFEGHSLDDDEDDDDVKDKRQTTLPRKRVSFGFERQVIDASDSDEENSLGRHNRPLDKGEGFDKLFRSSGEGSDDVSAKNEIVQKSREKRKGMRHMISLLWEQAQLAGTLLFCFCVCVKVHASTEILPH